MREKLELNGYLKYQRENIINLLDCIKNNNKDLFIAVQNNTPVELMDMLYNKVIYTERVADFVNKNKVALSKILDNRTPEEAVYNYQLCLISEIIIEVYINSIGFKTRRNSCDTNVNDNNHKLSIKSDLQYFYKNKWYDLELQFGYFKNKTIKIKKYKADKFLERNNNTALFVLSYNPETKTVEYVTFLLEKAINNKETKLDNNNLFFGKPVYIIPVNIFKIKKIA